MEIACSANTLLEPYCEASAGPSSDRPRANDGIHTTEHYSPCTAAIVDGCESTSTVLQSSDVPATAHPSCAPQGHRTAPRQAVAYIDLPDDELIEAVKSGEREAFGALCQRHTAAIRRRIRNILRNHEDIEDVLQETMFQAYRTLHQFRGTAKFSTWLTAIAINTSLMSLRKRRRALETSFETAEDDGQWQTMRDYPDSSLNPEQHYAREQRHQIVSSAVQMLPGNFRSVICQFHQNEATMKGAADALGITVPAAKSRLLRARRALRLALRQRKIGARREIE